MKIIVCIKQVPDTNEVKIDAQKGTLIREGVPSIINPEDKNGLEEAIRLKDELGAEVTVLTMGPPQADRALREALAMGADKAILISDRAFAGSDTLATSYILSRAVVKIVDFDLIFCGRQAIDGDTAQVGPQLAEHLGISQISYVSKIKVRERKVAAHRLLEEGYSVVETEMPLLFTVVDKINNPRYPSMRGIVDAYDRKKITVWGKDELKLDENNVGLAGSPTKVYKTFVPVNEKNGELLEGSPREQVTALLEKLAADCAI